MILLQYYVIVDNINLYYNRIIVLFKILKYYGVPVNFPTRVLTPSSGGLHPTLNLMMGGGGLTPPMSLAHELGSAKQASRTTSRPFGQTAKGTNDSSRVFGIKKWGPGQVNQAGGRVQVPRRGAISGK